MSSLVPGTHATDPTAEPQNMIEMAQQIRLSLINNMTTNGNAVPTDKDGVELLLKVLDSSDRSELTRLKIKSEEKTGEADRATALALAAMADRRMERFGNRNPYELQATAVNAEYVPTPPDLSALPPVNVTPGLASRGRHIESYDEFISRTGAGTNGESQ